METFTDAWAPRDAGWLRANPSPFAGTPGRPLILGGCPRSGTTLLRAILDNHPGVAVPPETNFVLPLWHERTRFGDLREEANRHAVAEWIFSPLHGGPRIRGDVPRRQAIARVVAAPPTAGGLLAACFGVYAQRTGKPRWGDKRPRYAMFIRAVFDLFPDAQFVNIVRDPRAAVASQIPMGWDEPEDALAGSTANWEMSVRCVDDLARRLRPDQLLDVRYEDLVREPEREVERVCAFAGLETGDAVAAALAAPRTGGRFDPDRHHRLAQPVSAERIASWRKRLPAADAALVERVAAPYLERFGYVPVHGNEPVDRAARRAVARQRRSRRARLRRSALRELARRAALDRRPVAAPPGSGSV
jgi:hypothetical protein